MKIFDATETDFTGYGLGPLPDALSAEITDELNGEFTLSLVYPEQGFNADKIATGNIIFTQARPSDTVGEPFRIRETENRIDKTIRVTAEHCSYDMNYIVFTGQINQTVTGIVNACNALNNYRTGNGFVRIWYDGIDTSLPTVFNISQIRMLSEAFGSGEGSLLATFGGDARYQYRPDLQRELVYICARRGVDRDIDIAYGFNMLSFLRVLNNGEQISHVRAYVERDNGGTLERAVEDFVLDAYLPTRWMLINVSDAVAWGATRAEIEAAVTAKLLGKDPTKVIESIQTSVVPGIALGIDETQIDVGDSLKVSYPQLGISGRIRIVKAVFNVITGHYDGIELGTIERNVADTIAGLSTNQTQASSGSGGSGGPYAAAPVPNGNAIRTNGILYGTIDNTSTATAFTATVAGLTSLYDGAAVMLKNGVVTSASGFTIDVNGLGAKPVYSNMAAATRETTIFNANYTLLFVYDSTRVEGGCWVNYRGYYSDANSIGYQLRTNSTVLKTADQSRYYRLFFTSADGTHWVPANTAKDNSATSTKTVNQRKIDPHGRIIYYSATTNMSAESDVPAAYCWDQNVLALGYSFNRTGAALTLTIKAPVYIKCAPQADGSAIIDSTTPFVQTLPSTEDGKIYIFLGVAYSATNVELVPHHPVYEFKSGAIRLWTNAAASGSTVEPATAAPLMDGTAAVGTAVKYAREDHVHPSDTTKANTSTVPNAASIDSNGLITFKHDNTALFTLQLPLYNGA